MKQMEQKFEILTNDQDFMSALENTNSYEEFEAAFAKEGVNLDEVFAEETAAMDAELSEDDLVDVAGGVSAKQLKKIVVASYKNVMDMKDNLVVGVWKYAWSCGVLLRAYYDVQKYGNATRSYSEKEIMKAAKDLGLE